MPTPAPSITSWARVEPRPREASIAPSLAARIRDPLWMLARQWQLGEFHGEDAGAPAFVQLAAIVSRFTGWRVDDKDSLRPLPQNDPLEDLVESEPFTPDVMTRVILGQVFEDLLAESLEGPSLGKVTAAVGHAYPLPPFPGGPAVPPLFTLALADPKTLLGAGAAKPSLIKAFEAQGIPLSKGTTVKVLAQGKQSIWLLDDPRYGRQYRGSWSTKGKTLAVRLEPLPLLPVDHQASIFGQACAGRSLDGLALYQAAKAELPILPAATAGAQAGALKNTGQALRAWVLGTYGELGTADPPAWKPSRLEYGIEVEATASATGAVMLAADPGRDGDFDWYAFDARLTKRTRRPTQTLRFSMIPGHVRFKGMPNARWWDFEEGTTPFGEIQPDKRDLAKLVLMNFMLVHGNDWFMIPIDQPVGSLCRIETLIVRDVFGFETLIERADAGSSSPDERWTMFSTTVRDTGTVANFFVVPPTAATAVQVGPTIEEVRFLRDELANMVWGIEHATENGLGEPWLGHERDLARKAATPQASPPAPTPAEKAPPLRYLLQTAVPENWIPFLPVALPRPVGEPSTLPERIGEIALERTLLQRATGQTSETVLPLGRILRPSSVGQGAYQICEEEVPREGVQVSRTIMRSRWTDGSTHLWIARRKSVGRGEGSSGLRFDLAVPADLPPGVTPP